MKMKMKEKKMYKLIDSEKFHHMNATVETVRFDDGMTVKRLISYDSVVCDIFGRQVYLYPRHRYSRTTTKQVTRFLTEQLEFPVCAGSLDDWKRQEKLNGYGFENGFYVHFPVEVLGTNESW
jgi:hypothetical protein